MNVWESIYGSQVKAFNRKNLVRYYFTPAIKHSKWSQTSCRGCWTVTANHRHIFWDCSEIVGHLRAVKDGMEKVLKLKTEFSFQDLHLGRKPPQPLSFHRTYTACF